MSERQCKISEVIFKEGNVPPVIGHFENGNLKPEVGNVRKCGIFRKNTEADKYIVAVHTSDDGLYMGTQPEEEPYRTLLAVQDKSSNKVRLIEVDQVSFKSVPVIPFTSKNVGERSVSDLYKSFGSKLIKRKTEQKERLAVDINTFSDRLHGTASNIDIDNALGIVDDSEFLQTFLPCNRNATHITNVYNLEDIISVHELEDLKQEAIAILTNSEEDNVNDYSTFLNANLKLLPDTKRCFYAQILLYAECLVWFLSSKQRSIKYKCPFSNVITKKILQAFTAKAEGGRQLSPSLKNKALSHLIVAGLLACKFTLNVESLYGLTHTPVEKFFRLCRLLGAVPMSKDMKNTIVLKVPFPVTIKPRIKKKKKERL